MIKQSCAFMIEPIVLLDLKTYFEVLRLNSLKKSEYSSKIKKNAIHFLTIFRKKIKCIPKI